MFVNTNTKSKKSKSLKTKVIKQLKVVNDVETLKRHYYNTGKAEGSGYYSLDTYKFMIDIDDGDLNDYKDFK